jgi:ribosome-associated heat shock protein Hsp15
MTPQTALDGQIKSADSVRIDKWLWAVRVFKTRSLASKSCLQGHVRILEQTVKPSRAVRVNDVIVVKKDQMTRTFKVLQAIEQRVGAPAAKDCVEDQTPAAEFEKPREKYFPTFVRPKGAGRPTKKERRQMEAAIAPPNSED